MEHKTNTNQLLDQLQTQINFILEHTGRILIAQQETTVPPIAQIARLKQAIPGASHHYHEALDHLEDDLRIAKLVLRRDLALLREDKTTTGQIKTDTESHQSQTASQVMKSDDINEDQPHTDGTGLKDDVMRDTSDGEPLALETVAGQELQTSAIISAPADSKPSRESNASGNQAAPKSPVSEVGIISLPAEDKTITEQPQSVEGEQAIEVNAVPPKDFATGNSNDGDDDLDALFNSEPSVDRSDNDPGLESTMDFDFSRYETNGSNQDSLSVLLPGLQDYAHVKSVEQTSGDPELDAIFGTDPLTDGHASRQGAFEENGKTDEFMDFGDFTGDASYDSGKHNGQDLDFDFT